jgi:3-dehydroquinate synthetase
VEGDDHAERKCLEIASGDGTAGIANGSTGMSRLERLIYRGAELHLQHIAISGDPFELGSSRPLDFGHRSAHRLEQLTRCSDWPAI